MLKPSKTSAWLVVVAFCIQSLLSVTNPAVAEPYDGNRTVVADGEVPDVTAELHAITSVKEGIELARALIARHERGEIQADDVQLVHFKGRSSSEGFRAFVDLMTRAHVPFVSDIVTSANFMEFNQARRQALPTESAVEKIAQKFVDKRGLPDGMRAKVVDWFSPVKVSERMSVLKNALFGTNYGTTFVSCFWRRTPAGKGEWRFGVDKKRLHATAFISAAALFWMNTVFQIQGKSVSEPAYAFYSYLTFGFAAFFTLFMRERAAIQLSRINSWWDDTAPHRQQLRVSANNLTFFGTSMLTQFVFGQLWTLGMGIQGDLSWQMPKDPEWNFFMKPALLAVAVAYSELALGKGQSQTLLKEEHAYHTGVPSEEIEKTGQVANQIKMLQGWVISPLLMFTTISANPDASALEFVRSLWPYAVVGSGSIYWETFFTGEEHDTVWNRLKYMWRKTVRAVTEKRPCLDVLISPVQPIETDPSN